MNIVKRTIAGITVWGTEEYWKQFDSFCRKYEQTYLFGK